MTAPRFDTVVHAPLRLQVCAMLAAVESAEFAAVRDELGVSDSVLSKHVKILDEAGYVRVRKAVASSRQRTWLALTADGRHALGGHVAELQRLLAPPALRSARPEASPPEVPNPPPTIPPHLLSCGSARST